MAPMDDGTNAQRGSPDTPTDQPERDGAQAQEVAKGNSPLKDSAGAGMGASTTDQPDPEREGFRERSM
jgi:hypothetical protein